MNNSSWVANNGWGCDNRTQSRWSNSTWDGSLSPSTSPSKGIPIFKSDPLEVPYDMTWNGPIGTLPIGNPLKTDNYMQNWKYGNPVQNKWSEGNSMDDKVGRRYEGE